MTEQNQSRTKAGKITYWIATVWLALGMTSTGIVQLMRMEEEVQMMDHLGYPIYFLTIIGVWKLLGAITILIPKFLLLKEWAYAGFVFAMTGAIISHIAISDGLMDLFGPTLLLVLTGISWYFRPTNRRLIPINTK
ncbi:DoxX family protein [Flagellimonas iocasae]|uniref:DoxX family protein n=1 Tax=Flagellimonas iocasae TaxID=2055905 RepID=A0ABW4XU91_9FLAO